MQIKLEPDKLKVNIEIEELLIAQEQNETIGERLTYLNEKLRKLSIKEKAYHHRSEQELEDVKQLEELGVKSIFKKVLGNFEHALEKERKEYLTAVLKHKAVEEEIAILAYEKDLLTKKYREPSKINEKLSSLVKKKEFLLKSSDSKFTKELFKRESELGRYKLLMQKSNRVLKKAELASKIIIEIKAELLEVRDWPPSGVGRYASVVKKKYIDRARAKSVNAKVRLDEFGEMAQKLFSEIKLEFKLDPFNKFLDIFYENMINDYVTQKKLDDTFVGINRILNDLGTTTEIILANSNKYSMIILEREKSLQDYTRDYIK